MSKAEEIKNRLIADNKRFWANDNIADYISDEDRQALIDETALQFEKVLQSLLIDTETDPNSNGTARRLSKMYWNELFSGRFEHEPPVTAFPNIGEEAYDGVLVVRAEINSQCSHHWREVLGVAYIGIKPNNKVLGLSKYIRVAKFHARRGTLQEELTQRIAKSISRLAECPDVAVYIEATHGCVSCRGVNQQNSLTQTTVLLGEFRTNPALKAEFFDNISRQKQ